MQGFNSNNCIQYFSIKNKNNNNDKTLGFSLIELSIVLIIIGLLVAGITGGQSLIESAKIRAAINELNGLKQTMFAFYAANGRLPGDLENKGTTGLNSDYDCPAGSFVSPYDKQSYSYMECPFVELELQGFGDYYESYKNHDMLKVFGKDNHVFFIMTFKRDGAPIIMPLYTFKMFDNIKDGSINLYFYELPAKNIEFAKAIISIDKKIDDGVYNSGTFRGGCKGTEFRIGETNYDEAMENIKNNNVAACSDFMYNLGF